MAPRHYHADCSGWHDRQRFCAVCTLAAAALCFRRGSCSHRHAQGNPARLGVTGGEAGQLRGAGSIQPQDPRACKSIAGVPPGP